MKIKSFLSALLLMVSTMASAQYLNVKLKDGTYSFKTSSDMEVSFGAKKGADVTESAQSVTVNGHTVAVKLADDTPASEVLLFMYVERGDVKILARSTTNKPLRCTRDDKAKVPAPNVSYGIYTFNISDITKDVVATVEYDQFTINLDYLSHGGTAPDISVMRGAEINVTPPTTDDGYELRGWYMEPSCMAGTEWSWDKIKANTSDDIKLYAKWVAKINGHDCVKLGGIYWATENVDSCCVTVVADPNTTDNGWGFYFYNQADDNALNAAKSWGGTWTLPSSSQFDDLMNKCTWTWIKSYLYHGKNVAGMFVTGTSKGEIGHSIFLPAAGRYSGGDSGVHDQGGSGFYWSTDFGSYLYFFNGRQFMVSSGPSDGMAVRPVSE